MSGHHGSLATEQSVEIFVKEMSKLFEEKESEDNWSQFEDMLIKFTTITKNYCKSTEPADQEVNQAENQGGANHKQGNPNPNQGHSKSLLAAKNHLVLLIKSKLKLPLIQSLVTERTRLARTALNLVSTLAACLGEKFELLSDLILPTVLKLTTRANKVYVSSATATLRICIDSAGLASFIPHLVESLKNQSKSLRVAAIESIVAIAKSNSCEALLPWLGSIEKAIGDGVVDPTPQVRSLAKELFEIYKDSFPSQLPRFQSTLSDMAKKYLKVTATTSSLPAVPVLSRRMSKGGNINSVKSSASDIIKPINSNTQKSTNTQENTIEALSGPEVVSRRTVRRKNEVSDTPLKTTTLASGPQRVARQPVQQTKPRMKPAQRVPSSSQPALDLVADSTPAPSTLDFSASAPVISETSEPTNQPATETSARQPKTHQKSPVIKKSTSKVLKSKEIKKTQTESLAKSTAVVKNVVERTVSISKLSQDLENTDWAIRQGVFTGLESYFSHSTRDFTSAHSEKSAKLMVDGLSDPHFKVVLSALCAVLAFIDAPDVSPAILEGLLPKVSSIAFNPTQKAKPAIVEKSKEVIDRILSRTSSPILGQVIVTCLGAPLTSGKIRVGLVGFIHSLPISTLTMCFANQSVCKNFAARMMPFVLDNDINILSMTKAIMVNMSHIYPDYMAQGLTKISASERTVLSNVTGKDFIMYALEIESAMRSRASSATDLAKKEDSTPLEDLEINYNKEAAANDEIESIIESVVEAAENVIAPLEISGEHVEEKVTVSDAQSQPSTPLKNAIVESNIDENISQKETNIVPEDENDAIEEFVKEESKPASPNVVINDMTTQATPVKPDLVETASSETLVMETTPKSIRRKLSNSDNVIAGGKTPTPKMFQSPPTFGEPENVIVFRSEAISPLVNLDQDNKSSADVKDDCHDSTLPVLKRRASLDPSKLLKTTPNNKQVSKKVASAFVSKLAEFKSPARVISSSKPSLPGAATPKASQLNSIRKGIPQPFSSKLRELTPEGAKSPIIENKEFVSARLIESPITENISSLKKENYNDLSDSALPVEIANVEEPLKPSLSSTVCSDPESEITVSEAVSEQFNISLGPSPLPSQAASVTHSRRSSVATNGLVRRKSLIPSLSAHASPMKLQNPSSPVDLLLDRFPKDLTGLGLKNKLAALHLAFKSSKDLMQRETVVKMLEIIFKLEGGNLSQQMAELSFTIDSFKTDIERKVDQDTLISSIVAILDSGVGIKTGLDMANRLVLKLGKSESEIPSWEMPLCHHIVQGLNASQSSVRKAASDLAVTFTTVRSEDWIESLYSLVKSTIGAPKEKILRSMIERKRAIAK